MKIPHYSWINFAGAAVLGIAVGLIICFSLHTGPTGACTSGTACIPSHNLGFFDPSIIMNLDTNATVTGTDVGVAYPSRGFLDSGAIVHQYKNYSGQFVGPFGADLIRPGLGLLQIGTDQSDLTKTQFGYFGLSIFVFPRTDETLKSEIGRLQSSTSTYISEYSKLGFKYDADSGHKYFIFQWLEDNPSWNAVAVGSKYVVFVSLGHKAKWNENATRQDEVVDELTGIFQPILLQHILDRVTFD